MTTPAIATPRRVLADLVPGDRVRDVLLVLAGTGLVAVAAQVSIHTPLSPVPFTLQTLAALVAGGVLGASRGLSSLVLYVVAGLAGVPWFANGSSGYGATFGYIVGFTLAAGLVGALARRGADRTVWTNLLVMAAGVAVNYLVGAVWLGLSLHLSVGQTWTLGVQPFVAVDALKALVAALLLPAAWKLVSRGR